MHAYIVDSHRELCNKLITTAKYFPVEKMHFQALQKKAKETRRQEKKTEVKQKDGTVKVIQKYKHAFFDTMILTVGTFLHSFWSISMDHD